MLSSTRPHSSVGDAMCFTRRVLLFISLHITSFIDWSSACDSWTIVSFTAFGVFWPTHVLRSPWSLTSGFTRLFFPSVSFMFILNNPDSNPLYFTTIYPNCLYHTIFQNAFRQWTTPTIGKTSTIRTTRTIQKRTIQRTRISSRQRWTLKTKFDWYRKFNPWDQSQTWPAKQDRRSQKRSFWQRFSWRLRWFQKVQWSGGSGSCSGQRKAYFCAPGPIP